MIRLAITYSQTGSNATEEEKGEEVHLPISLMQQGLILRRVIVVSTREKNEELNPQEQNPKARKDN
jgi:hypothetical protein